MGVRLLSRMTLLGLLGLMLLAACGGAPNGASPTAVPPTATVAEPTAAPPAADRGDDAVGPAGANPLTAGDAANDVEPAAGRGVIYTVPFEVQPDGFGFRNYGPGYPEGDFTIAELHELFGDGVCSRVDEEEGCIPTAEAQQWIADRNADMRVGHCIGFTVTSHFFSQGDLQPEEFESSADTPYELDQDVPLMRDIALNGSLYWVKSVWSSEVSGTPRDIIDALIARREPVDLSIFLPGLVGGHSLLAYGVAEVAPDQYRILAYDNNFPGKETFVEVDYAANTWRYREGAVNPDVAAIPYEGDAASETLRFIPLSAYETATCPFCPVDADDADAVDTVTLISVLGQGDVLVKTALGVIGAVAGEIVNDIPGAKLIFQRGQLAATGSPDIALPATPDYELEFSGLERVSSQSPAFSLVVDNLTPATESNELVVAADSQSVAFQAGGEQSPLLNVTIREGDTAYSVALVGVEFQEGQGVSVGVPADGAGLEIQAQELEISDATMLITRQTAEGEAIFATTDLVVADGGGVKIDVTEWDGSGSIEQYTDDNGDGTYDEEPVDLDNEPLEDVLEQSDPDTAATIIDVLSPVQGGDDIESLLAALPVDELTGQEIGRILQPLNLTDEQLIAFIAPLDLPAAELAELLFALRLPPERLDAVIAGLELEEDAEAALRAALAELALFQEILSEWVFLNTTDMAQLAGLLSTHDLTAAQLARFITRLGLDEAAIEQLLLALALPLDDLVIVVEALGVDMPPTPTPTPTETGVPAEEAAVTPTLTVTLTTTATIAATDVITGTPEATGTPDPYPGALPTPTDTPEPYPYPDPPTATPGGDPYPGVTPSPTPAFDSTAFCDGDDLRIVAEEPEWIAAAIEIWSGEALLFSGETGPEGEPLRVTIPGPGTWAELRIESSIAPETVRFRPITCPEPEAEPEGAGLGAWLLAMFGDRP